MGLSFATCPSLISPGVQPTTEAPGSPGSGEGPKAPRRIWLKRLRKGPRGFGSPGSLRGALFTTRSPPVRPCGGRRLRLQGVLGSRSLVECNSRQTEDSDDGCRAPAFTGGTGSFFLRWSRDIKLHRASGCMPYKLEAFNGS